MKKILMLVRLDTNYCNYLREYDNKVPYNYNEKKIRPFVGVLFIVNDFMYFAPLSSPKKKHLKMKNKIDFLKLDNGNLGVVNFNNMLPVTEANIYKINLNENNLSKSEKNYINLLKDQIHWLNRNKDKLYKKSKSLYDKYINNKLDINTLNRCCNFKLLEEKCTQYNSVTSS